MNNFEILSKLMHCFANAEVKIILNKDTYKIDYIDNSAEHCVYITLKKMEDEKG